MVNCGHYPIPFIPGFSDMRGQPQNEEDNEKTYAESQQQRALERKLRTEKRDLMIMQTRGVPDDMIREQQKRVKQASHDIQTFCDETGRTRRRNREYTPINATFPPKETYDKYSMPTETRNRLREWFKEN